MKTYIAAVLIALFALAIVGGVWAFNQDNDAKTLTGCGSSLCKGTCSAEKNCGSQSCEALNGGSCTCGKTSSCNGSCSAGNSCSSGSCGAKTGSSCGCGKA